MSLLTISETSAPRAGRRFTPGPELLLEAEALSVADSLAGTASHARVVREMAGPLGIPDFVVALKVEEWFSRRNSLGIAPILNAIDVAIVSVLFDRQVLTIETLSKRLGWPIDTLDRRFPGLIKSGAVRPVGRGFQRPAGLAPVHRLFAVENKLRDWRKALRQAHMYSTWADGCVLVFDSLSDEGLSQVRAASRRMGVGVWQNGDWIVRGRTGRLPTQRRLHASEHLFAALS